MTTVQSNAAVAASKTTSGNPTSIEDVKKCMNSKIFIDQPYKKWKSLGIMFNGVFALLLMVLPASAQTVAFESDQSRAAWYGQAPKAPAKEIKSVIISLDDDKLNNSFVTEFYVPKEGEKNPYAKLFVTESYYAEAKLQKIYGKQVADKTKEIVKLVDVMIYVMVLADKSQYHRVIYHGELLFLEKYDQDGHSVYRKEY